MDNQNPQAEQYASEETREVLREVLGKDTHLDGIDLPVEEKPAEEQKTPEEPKQEEPKVEEITPDENKGEEEKPKPTARRSDYVPTHKYNALRKELQEVKRQLEEKQSTVTQPAKTEVKGSLKDIADKYNLDEGFVNEFSERLLNEAASKAPKLPEDIIQKLQTLETKEKMVKEDMEFEQKFNELSKDLPGLVGSKAEFKQLAFTEGYETTPLPVLAHYFMSINKPTKTAEAPKKGAGKTEVMDFSQMTEEQLSNISPDSEEFNNYLAWIKKTSGHYGA